MDFLSTKIHTGRCPVCGSNELLPFLNCKDYLISRKLFSVVKCKACSFGLTQDFPPENEIGEYYDSPNYVSHSDTAKGFVNRLYHWARAIALNSKAKVILRYSTNKTGTLLDIGSGTGYFLNKMRKLKWIVTGIEKSESACRYAKTNFDISCQSPEYLYEIKENSKDVVTMWHVLEHMHQLNRVMEHIHSILKPDGLLLIALPNKNSFDAFHYKEYWAAYDVPRHLWHFSPDDFERLAARHQFRLINKKAMYFDAFYISMLSEKNKGAVFGTILGLIKGSVFFLRTLADKERSSSLIYILKKEEKQ